MRYIKEDSHRVFSQVHNPVRDSVWNHVHHSVYFLVWDLRDPVRIAIEDSVCLPVKDSIMTSLRAPIKDQLGDTQPDEI